MNPVLVKAGSNVFIDFIKLRNSSSYILYFTCPMATRLVFCLPEKHNSKKLLSSSCIPLQRRKVVLLSPGQPPCFYPGSLLLYSPNQSDLISSYISELNNNNEFSVAIPVISLNYQFKIITS